MTPANSLPCPTEHEEQVALIKWARAYVWQGKRLGDYLLAVPNGASLTKRGGAGSRYSPQAAKLKAEGMSPGFPDLFLAIPSGPYHGLMVEMKRAKKSLSRVKPEQLMWAERLNGIGYKSVIAYGFFQAQSYILQYLTGADNAKKD